MLVSGRFVQLSYRLLGVIALLATLTSNATAQLVVMSSPRIIITPTAPDNVFGSDAAYDPANHVYLVVMGLEQGATLVGSVMGAFLDTDGQMLGTPFVVHSGLRANFARAIYSPHVSNGMGGTGGFLVTWSELNTTYVCLVAYPSGIVGAVQTLAPGYNGPVETAYSPVSRIFVSAWESKDVPAAARFMRIATSGFPVGAAVSLPNAASSWVIWNSVTSAAWNASQNEFGVVYVEGTSPSNLRLARVTPSGAIVDTQTVASLSTTPYAATIQYNSVTGNYVLVWSDTVAGTINAAEVSGMGAVIARGVIGGGLVASQNGLALSYNAASGTFLLLGFTQVNGNESVKAVELNSHGAVSSTMISVPGVSGQTNFAPRAAARSDAPEWLVADGSSSAYAEVLQTASAHGGTDVRLDGCSGTDPFAALGGGTCVNGGWLPPGMISSGTTPPDNPTPPPPPPPSGCATPDPFTAMGGGTCVNGGWLPPGMISNGTTPSGNPTPPPPPPLPPSGCATPDPFTAMGGGTCVNGGWLPPGMISSGTTAPENPTPPPPPPPSGCATPDPFTAMGGGTCVNGGWLPPGMIPSGTTAPANPIPPSPPSMSTCATPDPFVVLGGGTCYNGGWFPPGMVIK